MTEINQEYLRLLGELFIEIRQHRRCIAAIEGQIKELKIHYGVSLYE